MNFNLINPLRMMMTCFSVAYVFALPYLCTIGFSQCDGTSISEFIDNAHATGAMAVVSYTPLTILLEYQDLLLDKLYSNDSYEIVKKLLRFSLNGFLGFFGAFLICNVSYCPTIHSSD